MRPIAGLARALRVRAATESVVASVRRAGVFERAGVMEHVRQCSKLRRLLPRARDELVTAREAAKAHAGLVARTVANAIADFALTECVAIAIVAVCAKRAQPF